jgi:flagellar M-ring protein FliF
VQVYGNLNVNQTTSEQLTYGKESVPLTQSKNIETLQGTGSGTGGAAGTATIPNYTAGGSGGKSNYKHEITQTTLGVNKTVTHSMVAPGAVETQHISVLLDKSVPAAAVPAIREAITNAAGVEPKRGDTISIGQMAFSKATTTAPAGTSAMMAYAKDALLGLASIIFLFLTTRFLRKREKASISHEPAWLNELQMPVRLAELERDNAPSHTPGAPLALANGGGSMARRQVEELAASSPDAVAAQVRTWMKED